MMTPRDGCLRHKTANNSHKILLFFRAWNINGRGFRRRTRCRWLINRCHHGKNSPTRRAGAKHQPSSPRTRGPESVPCLNRRQAAKRSPWIPACAQGCPGKIVRRHKGGNWPPGFVLAGLVPAIHAFAVRSKGVDTRIKSAQDHLRLMPVSPRQVILARKISHGTSALARERRLYFSGSCSRRTVGTAGRCAGPATVSNGWSTGCSEHLRSGGGGP
jgi:hypothetical protein